MGYSVVGCILGVYSITGWLATAYNGVLYEEGGDPKESLLNMKRWDNTAVRYSSMGEVSWIELDFSL